MSADISNPTGIYWPTPPYAIYHDAEPWVEPQLCEIEGLNGAVHNCLLVSILPADKAIMLQVPQRKSAHRLRFSDFLRLTLKAPLQPGEPVGEGEFANILGFRATVDYKLSLNNGSTRSGRTVGYIETQYGIFLFNLLNAQGSVERVFIPREAYLSVSYGQRIGELLVEQQMVTAQQVEQAVSEQENLRKRKLGDYLTGYAIVSPEQLVQALDQQSKMPMILVGEALTRLGYVNREQLELALKKQKTERAVPLGQLLVNMGFLTRHDLNLALVRKMGYPVVDVANFPIEAEALRKIPMSMAQRLGIVPLLARDHMVVVAAADPTRRDMIEELEFVLQSRVFTTLALGDDAQIQQNLVTIYERMGLQSLSTANDPTGAPQAETKLASTSELLESLESNQNGAEEVEEHIEQSDNSLVLLINTMIIEAHNRGVSDIHIETHPGRTKIRIRFRHDGVLSPYLKLPYTYRAALIARLKIMADLDISERRKPQDGKINFAKFSSNHRLELRVATIPTYGGLEDVVMRLLSSVKPLPLEKLGMTPDNLQHLRESVSRPYGMVLCVGPTGSGKTTTLHSVLDYLNTPQRKIWTAEDPIEITQPDLRQVQVNPKIDWTFAKALRAFLRADPDIIMLGEIRDGETAKIAIEAALTGHLVLSTLHTNSAAETVTRLVDMGIDPFNFSDSLLAVLAQRLVRRLCPDCLTREDADDVFIDELLDDYLRCFASELRPARELLLGQWLRQYGRDGHLPRYHAAGCDKCHGTGQRGRVGLHELLLMTPGLRRLIQTNARPELMQFEAMQNGHLRILRQDGIDKVLQGLVRLEEVRANSNV